MQYFLKSLALWVLNNMPAVNAVGFLVHLHVGKIPLMADVKVRGRLHFHSPRRRNCIHADLGCMASKVP